MKTIRKNRKEDLKLLIDLGENYHGEDVTFTFSAGRYGVEKYVCSYIGGEAVNLVVTGTAMLCLLDNHRLPLGTLSVEIDIRVPDTQMPDGDFRHVTRKAAAFSIGGEQCTVELTNGASDYFPEELVPEAVINLLPTVIKGDPGQDADIEGCNQAIAAMVALTEEVDTAEIKRAEAEQQRMDSEAERTAAENERKAAENERAKAETQRQSAEALREEAENTRTETEETRITKEAERINAETARQTAESLRKSNETKRTESETARTEAEKARAAAETSRTQAETQRANAEKQRIANENERKEAETQRAAAEALRANNETARNNAETQRAEAERQRAAAEAARQTAESSRDETETTRQQNETARTEAETQRVAAETERTKAEDTRNQKESERQEAEQERIANNEKCVTATNTALTAAEEARAAANTAMQVASTAEATIAKSEKAASDAAAAVETANSALSTAADATTAANKATNDANNAAGEANAAADRANTAANLVYNGPDENVSVACYTDVEGVSTAGLVLNVYINDSTVPQQYTTDSNGLAAFKVTKGLRYDIVFPDIEGCAPIGRLSYTAALQTRGIEVTYHEAIVAAQEKVTISFMKFPENTTWNGGEPYPDGVARVTIDGVETVYNADSNGQAQFFVPIGKEYRVSIDKPADLHLITGAYSATYTADRAARVILVSFHPYLSDILIVDKDGGEWTYDGFIASGKDVSEGVLLHIATEELLAVGCDFFMSVDVMAYRKFDTDKTEIRTMSWAAQSVQFTSIPLNGNDASQEYYYDGLTATNLIVQEGLSRGINTDCHTRTLRETYALGVTTLQGFTPSTGQYAPLIANYTYINDIITFLRPDGDVVNKFWNFSKGTSTQQSATHAYCVSRYVQSSSKNYGNYAPVCAFAKPTL